MDYEPWLLDLVNWVVALEREHPPLFKRGDLVGYDKPVDGEPRFEHAQGYLVGEKWHCAMDWVRNLPPDVITAATWYARGKQAAKEEK